MENLRVRGMRHLATTCGVVAFREAFEPCGLPTAGERVLSNFHRWIESLGVSTLRDRRTEAERETVQRPTNVVARPNNRAKISSLEHVLPNNSIILLEFSRYDWLWNKFFHDIILNRNTLRILHRSVIVFRIIYSIRNN